MKCSVTRKRTVHSVGSRQQELIAQGVQVGVGAFIMTLFFVFSHKVGFEKRDRPLCPRQNAIQGERRVFLFEINFRWFSICLSFLFLLVSCPRTVRRSIGDFQSSMTDNTNEPLFELFSLHSMQPLCSLSKRRLQTHLTQRLGSSLP
jgi:hypothetical protein